MVSFNVVSEIAIVPDSECKMPTFMVSAAVAPWAAVNSAAADTAVVSRRKRENNFMNHFPSMNERD